MKIRRAKVGDEKGIAEVRREGLKRKNWLYTGGNIPSSKEKIKKMREDFSSKSSDSFFFVAIDEKTNKVVGSAMASFKLKGRLRHRVDVGWGVHPDYQKKGIGTQLLKELLKFCKKKGFKRAEAEAAIENKGSVKLAKKIGFKIEGIKKKALLMDNGRCVDTYIFGKILT